MKITLSNIGPIKQCTIELGKLTVIAGGNNTGKTYLTYTLYGLFRNLVRQAEFPEITRPLLRDLAKEGVGEVDFTDSLIFSDLNAAAESYVEDQLSRVFSAEEEYFSDPRIFLEPTSNETLINPAIQ